MRKIALLFLFVLFMVSWTGVYAAPDTAPAAKPAISLPKVSAGKTVEARGSSRQPVLSQVRWANHTEALTGSAMLRLVMDVSGPVEASGVVIAGPTPQLSVIIKGTTPAKTIKNLTFDGKVIEKVSFAASGQDTKVIVDLPSMADDLDYRVFTLPSDPQAKRPFRVIVDINEPVPLPDYSFTPGLKNKVIALDPGHGGSDPGAIGPSNYMEKTATLAVAKRVQALLEKAGAKVIMTREEDCDVFGPKATAAEELNARSTAANSRKADVFLSIHINAFTDRSVGGTSTYYYQKTKYDLMLAQALQTSLVEAGKLQDRRANPANFYVIKRTRMPAALIELAFISNPDEEKLLRLPDFQQKMSLGIVRGLERFFDQAAKLN
ncbi:N-acetylmuramoyl-L-alanine amidase family protein [Sporomusa termitida]|uniref:N-acetylmuramoyl-L-alanine amidase CwlD n=1 Tax=Sporomusa termitida TaxID=2377 RepID=A0A517DQH9_9FIRM|nr:N-acetylmuramoyl-L-alanine amidase [Sporomusa termitida]QDR79577.1 N-acetylmuramoyl-L-alanine amidase CwlD [Sporomusa termitida]